MALRSLVLRTNFHKCMVANYCTPLSWIPKDEKTHTGQTFAPDDYRLVRFIDKKKLVNPNWGIKLIAEVPPTKTTSRVVWCDGGGGPTGHPKVYINLDKPGAHSCNYCGLRFEKETSEH
ncbi:UNVERIFIED_CONTAM: hypothetical protein PYX00_006300 [Menopon gallinae]|uniref:Zinc finger CHCC-type domain-containing protein n=1 Tax=Menopon gallinae TaxID=328185 RepID=A0AAW2HVC4_9NEOP